MSAVAVAEVAVSNICWPHGPAAQEAAIDTLHSMGVHSIDIAPGKAFPEMAKVGSGGIDEDELAAFRRTLRSNVDNRYSPLRVAGLQGVTFGRPPTETIFSEDPGQADRLRDYVAGIIRLAEFVGAQTIVYGSGGTRLTGDLDKDQAYERAAEFFGSLGQLARDSGVTLGIEPVSTIWTKGQPVFGRTAAEVLDFATRLKVEIGMSAVKLVPDSFAMADGEDNFGLVIERARENGLLAAHAQIAEPGMAAHTTDSPIGWAHRQMDAALAINFRDLADQSRRDNVPMPVLAIEMFEPKDGAGSPASPAETRLAINGIVSAARRNYASTLGQ